VQLARLSLARQKSLDYLRALLSDRRRITMDTVDALLSSPREGSDLDEAGHARIALLESRGAAEFLAMDREVEAQLGVMRGALERGRLWVAELCRFVLLQVRAARAVLVGAGAEFSTASCCERAP
jgi:hypothetical protein